MSDLKHPSDEESAKHIPSAAPPYDAASTSSTQAICPAHTTENKIKARIDLHIIPFVIVLYLMAFLDRVNIANARAFGLEKDLGMAGNQYNTALVIFFVPYILFEVPSNILLKHFSPRKWLRDDEREFVKARLAASSGPSGADRKITFKDVKNALCDYKIWLGAFMYFGLIVPAYSYAYFAPTIIQSYKYSPIETQLRSVPPWAVAFGFAMVVATLSDWAKHRFLFVMGAICIAISGFAVLITVHDNLSVQYGALFLVVMGTYSAMPVQVCWFNMNLAGHHRRAIGSAWQIGFGNIGGIISTFSFVSTDAPYYKKGYAICVSFICLSVLASAAYAAAITWENKKRAKTPQNLDLTEQEKMDLGDMNPEFRYML
ncbi:High-affinity nicotinic acid transporter [Collariella sp. IMI 366227]|nr:High-affinity nicotinic acid transporter [Collariella sp. IMI 366227]